MCGIFAIFAKKTRLSPNLVEICTNLATHRGPDDGDFYQDGQIGLGHRRLSVIDLSINARQPMVDETGQFCLVYNGEIYNYRELKAKLPNPPQKFQSQSDSEILLLMLKNQGINALNQMNGMWAFALWQKNNGEFLFARDRWGVKPLYYLNNDEYFALASEIKQLYPLISQKSLHQDLVLDFLQTGITNHNNQSFYREINQIPASHYGVFNINSQILQIKPYYQPKIAPFLGDKHDAIAQCQNLMQDAVALRLHADVDMAACVSGGVDSSTIMACLPKNQGTMATYSVLSANMAQNEEKYAKIINEKFHCHAHYLTPTPQDFMDNWLDLVRTQEEPFGGASVMMQYLLMQAAQKNGNKILLDGQGADEIFLGYERYFALMINQYIRRGQWRKLAKFLYDTQKNNANLPLGRLAQYYLAGNSDYWRIFAHKMQMPYLMRHELPAEVKKFQSCVQQPTLQSLCEIHHTNLPMLLRFADKNSARFGIETRNPFCDYRVVEFGLNLPLEYKIRHGWNKWILRRSFDNILPHEISYRKDKLGFVAPSQLWITHLEPEVISLIAKSQLLINICNTKKLVANFEKISLIGKWRIASLVFWEREFL